MGIKRTQTDKWFSQCVRERTNWECERCGKVYTEGRVAGKARGLHCSHFYGRGTGSLMRHYGRNCFAHCHGCHQYFEARPNEFRNWVKDRLGDEDFEALVLRAGKPFKRPKYEAKEMKDHFESQYKDMRKRRDRGEGGRIEFVEWD